MDSKKMQEILERHEARLNSHDKKLDDIGDTQKQILLTTQTMCKNIQSMTEDVSIIANTRITLLGLKKVIFGLSAFIAAIVVIVSGVIYLGGFF